ncbi:hypothetical protein TRV_06084 [Trichophyton verrucosum HKI 0517]|uniref:Uncharacterized protein n=1 Tax=Trichophyton verrucosum (strain HKI 0517) TaxID=663202 RepID=D4DFY1_TRIVH|nr:uncharacterized protein TRV_06084 [Trichophyton verrucosum HKI 0517]EFE39262.1 hypothetical protein TRV_06084 [Trichophyton verrucosum HKI 0517]
MPAGKQSKQANVEGRSCSKALLFLARTRLAGLLGPVTRLLTHNTIWTSMKKKKKNKKKNDNNKDDTTSQGIREKVICWLVDSSRQRRRQGMITLTS